jgi:hypothetical protein
MNLWAFACLAFWLVLTACEISPLHTDLGLNISGLNLGAGDAFYNLSGVAGLPTPEFPKVHSAANPPAPGTLWYNAYCRGARLHVAMTFGRDRASMHVTPLDSAFDGEMVQEMNMWGYKDETEEPNTDKECDMDKAFKLKRAFDELHISTLSAGPGRTEQVLQVRSSRQSCRYSSG